MSDVPENMLSTQEPLVPVGSNEVVQATEVPSQTVIDGPPTHVVWRDDAAEFVHTHGYTEDNPNLEPLPDGYWDKPMVADPATRTFAPDFNLVKKQKLRAISDARDYRIEQFHAFQKAIPLDTKTQSLLTGAAFGLVRNPQITQISWSLGGGEFLVLPRDVVLSLADGGFMYVQNMFAKHGALAAQVKALCDAEDIDGLMAIDETDDAHWT